MPVLIVHVWLKPALKSNSVMCRSGHRTQTLRQTSKFYNSGNASITPPPWNRGTGNYYVRHKVYCRFGTVLSAVETTAIYIMRIWHQPNIYWPTTQHIHPYKNNSNILYIWTKLGLRRTQKGLNLTAQLMCGDGKHDINFIQHMHHESD